MQRQILLSQLASQPWAMEPTHLANMASVLHRWASGEPASAETMEAVSAAQAARQARKASVAEVSGSIKVLPLWGVMSQRANMAREISGAGGTSTQMFSQMFRDAMADDSVGGILIDLDSPGGSVFGTDELASEVRSARGKKPVFGFVNSLCASAAYWVGAQCEELYCTAGGQTGSIGVYTQHVDESGALEKAGLKAEFISAGRYKTEGNSFGPLTDEGRAFIQSQIDSYYNAFTQAVARGRGVSVSAVRSGMGQGRCLLAGEALKAGMINGIDTFDGVVSRLVQRARSAGSQAKSQARSVSIASVSAMSGKSEQDQVAVQIALRRRQLQMAEAGIDTSKMKDDRAARDAAKRRRDIELAKIS